MPDWIEKHPRLSTLAVYASLGFFIACGVGGAHMAEAFGW